MGREHTAVKKSFLICTGCGRTWPVTRAFPRCDFCAEPLEVRGVVPGRIRGSRFPHRTLLERYRDFFPFRTLNGELSLGEGFTPLVRSARLAGATGLGDLFFKNETVNPTWSFKDRGTVSGVQHALCLGYDRIGTVSSGNMAASVAAYGARAGLKTFVLVSAALPAEKIAPIAIHGPVLIRVDGDYGELYFRSIEIGKRRGIYFINSDVPFRVEGSKTIAFEICEQLRFRVPDWVVVPVSAGGNLRGIIKGFEEFRHAGLIAAMPRFAAVQAAGCAPVYRAFREGSERVQRVERPETLAHAIENPFPPSGNEVLRKIRAMGGVVAAVSDEEMIAAQRELAGEGILAQPEGAAPIAAVRSLAEEGRITRGETVVCIVTGGGLKYTAAFDFHRFRVADCTLSTLEDHILSEDPGGGG